MVSEDKLLIDIHCHILPGVDDGAVDLEMALTMARLAHADGITKIVATPHYNFSWKIQRDLVLRKTEQLQREFHRHEIPITLYAGNEVRLENIEFIHEALATRDFCYLADQQEFILLEQSWEGYHPDTPDILTRLNERGTKMIIPHPERHFFFRENPELLDELVALGAWTQVSVDSLIGKNGAEAENFALQLLSRGSIHTLATDAHNTKRRPNLSLGYAIVEQRAGISAADAIRSRMLTIVP